MSVFTLLPAVKVEDITLMYVHPAPKSYSNKLDYLEAE
jgi:hypothetical protein